MNESLITIGLICYNAEKSLDKVMACINRQTWPNLEILAVDDVSTDRSYQILQSWANQDPRVRVVQNLVNSGAGYSRQQIVLHAQGEFIVFFDDDDISHPERIKNQYEAIIHYEQAFKPEAPVICHVSRQVEIEGEKPWFVEAMGSVPGMAPHGGEIADFLLIGKKSKKAYGSIGTGIQMARRQSYLDAGNFDPLFRRCQDTELAVRWAYTGAHFIGLKEVLVTQAFTVTGRKIDLEKKYALMTFEKHKDYLLRKGLYQFIVNWTSAKYAFWEGRKGRCIGLIALCFARHPFISTVRMVQAFKGFWYNRMLRRKYNNL